MSATGIVITIVVVVAVLVIAAASWSAARRRRLQQRFGPEYDPSVAEQPNRSAAEHVLRAREQRRAELDIKPLSAHRQQHYLAEWQRVQAAFVEDPSGATIAADVLVTQVMIDRGYPTSNYDEQIETLSVDQARTIDHYRQAHEISQADLRGEASTEQLRQALVHYRALAHDLLGTDDAGRDGDKVQRNEGKDAR